MAITYLSFQCKPLPSSKGTSRNVPWDDLDYRPMGRPGTHTFGTMVERSTIVPNGTIWDDDVPFQENVNAAYVQKERPSYSMKMGVSSERQCDICNIGFPTEYSLREHRLSLMHHKILNHQLRNQGMHDPEHFCFLCQKSLRFNAWADHLLDYGHRQRVLSMKAEEHAATNSLSLPTSGDLQSLSSSSVNSSTKGSDKIDAFPRDSPLGNRANGQSPDWNNDRLVTDSDWIMDNRGSRESHPIATPPPARTLDIETERLIKKTQALLRSFSERQRPSSASAEPQKFENRLRDEEVDDLTPVSSLQSSARSDLQRVRNGEFSASLGFSSIGQGSRSGSSSRQRIRRRACRRTSSRSSSSTVLSTPAGMPVIEPVVHLPPTSQTAFQFGASHTAPGFTFSLSDHRGSQGIASSSVSRMHEALLLSKEEESLRNRIVEVDDRLEILNARVEELLAKIATEEEIKDSLRVKEAQLRDQRMNILKSFCGPQPNDVTTLPQQVDEYEEGETVNELTDNQEERLNLGLDSARSTSPELVSGTVIPDLHIGDQTRRDILTKIMEGENLNDNSSIEEKEETVTEKGSRQSHGERRDSESSSDTVRLLRASSKGKLSEDRRSVSTRDSHSSVRFPVRRQRDPSLTTMMKEYLHHEPSSSDVDLEQTPRDVVSDAMSVTSGTTNSLPSTAAHIFPGVIHAHDSFAVLDMFIYKGYLYTAGEDTFVRKFSLQHARLIECIHVGNSYPLHFVRRFLQPPKVGSRSHDCLCEYRGHSKLVHCIALSDESKGEDRLFTGGFDKMMFIFNVKTGKEVNKIAFDAAVHAMVIAFSTLHLGLANGRLVLYSLPQRRLLSSPRSLSQQPLTCLAAIPQHSSLLVGADGDGIRVVSRTGNVLLHILPTEFDLLPLTTLHVFGRIVAFHEQTLLCYHLQTGAMMGQMEFPARISCLSQTPNHVLVGTVEGRVHRVRNSRFLQEGEFAVDEEDEVEDGMSASVQMTNVNEAILSMTYFKDTIFVGDEKGRISIRQL